MTTRILDFCATRRRSWACAEESRADCLRRRRLRVLPQDDQRRPIQRRDRDCDTGCSVKFDSIDCLLAYYRRADQAHDVGAVWVADFRGQGDMLDANSARFVDLGFGRTAIGCGWAAVATARDAAAIGVIDIGRIKRWSELQ